MCLLKFLYLVFETRFFFWVLACLLYLYSFTFSFNSATLRYILSYRDNACYVFPSIASISSNTYLFIVTSDFKLHMEITKISVVVVRDHVTAWPPGQSGNFIHRLNQKSPLARPQVNDLGTRLWVYRVYGRWQIRLVVIVVWECGEYGLWGSTRASEKLELFEPECENADRTVEVHGSWRPTWKFENVAEGMRSPSLSKGFSSSCQCN